MTCPTTILPGSLFRIDSAGTFTDLGSHGVPDEFFPNGLVSGSDGAFYGTIPHTGEGGVIVRIDDAGNFSLVHTFGSASGQYPIGDLVVGSDGAIYGTTESGGSGGGGVVYRFTVPEPEQVASLLTCCLVLGVLAKRAQRDVVVTVRAWQ
jgi:uncharacterized repeat protein (TIGR03803 family)